MLLFKSSKPRQMKERIFVSVQLDVELWCAYRDFNQFTDLEEGVVLFGKDLCTSPGTF